MAGNPGGGGWGGGGGGPFGPPGGAPPGGGGYGPPGGFGPPGGPPPGGFGPPGGAPPGGFGQPPGGGFGQPPGGFGQPPGGFGQPPGGYPQQGFPPAPGGFGQGGFPPPQKSNTGMFIGIGVGVMVLACGVCGVIGYMKSKKDQQTFGPLAAACRGQGVAGARMYNPASPPHRLVGVRNSGGDWTVSTGLIPSSRRSDNVANTDVVACLGPDTEQTIATCEVWSTRNGLRVPGTTRNYPRVRRFSTIRLVSAQTGVVLNTGVVAGPMPSTCNGYVGRRASASTFRGSLPGSTEIGQYLDTLPGL